MSKRWRLNLRTFNSLFWHLDRLCRSQKVELRKGEILFAVADGGRLLKAVVVVARAFPVVVLVLVRSF